MGDGMSLRSVYLTHAYSPDTSSRPGGAVSQHASSLPVAMEPILNLLPPLSFLLLRKKASLPFNLPCL